MYVPKAKRKAASIFNSQKKKTTTLHVGDSVPNEFISQIPNYSKLPPNCIQYIQKCFKQCNTDISREIVSNKLVRKLEAVAKQGMLNHYNWSCEEIVSAAPPAAQASNSWSSLFKQKIEPKVVFDSNHIQETAHVDKTAKANYMDITLEFKQKANKASLTKAQKKQDSARRTKIQALIAAKLQTENNEQLKSSIASVSPAQKIITSTPPIPLNSTKQVKNTEAFKEIVIEKQNPAKQNILTSENKNEKKKNKSAKGNNEFIEKLLSGTLSDIIIPKNKNKTSKKVSNSFVINPQKRMTRASSFEELVNENRIIGTSKDLEKQYLRMTGEPDPETIRPLKVLIESLTFCLNKFESNHDYEYIRDQLRSIRQDLTVQAIENEFSVKVYEIAARLAIEHKDWDNFNQSLTPLEALYSKGLGELKNISEIAGYKIAYLIGYKDVTGLYTFLPRLSEEVRISDSVRTAITAWTYVTSSDWPSFFYLTKSVEPLMASVLSIAAESIRRASLQRVLRSHRSLRLSDYIELLCFDDESQCRSFLDDEGVIITPN